MHVIFIVFFVLASLAPVEARAAGDFTGDLTGNEPDLFYSCLDDTDCMVTEAECPEWTAINKNYKAQYEEHRDKLRPVVECVSAEFQGPAPERAICKNMKCATLDEKPK